MWNLFPSLRISVPLEESIERLSVDAGLARGGADVAVATRQEGLSIRELEACQIAFSRLTQMGFLRLMTTAAAMDGRPLSMAEAWRVHDRLLEDDRVTFVPEPAVVETRFRAHACGGAASPKLWADAWLLAFAETAGGFLVTFDRALAARSGRCVLLS